MKFGKTLLRNQITEWSKNYIAYKILKKTINEVAAVGQLPPSEEAITAIFFQLDRELEKVNTFYTYKQSHIDRRLWILSEKYNQCTTEGVVPAATAVSRADPGSYTDIEGQLFSALQETRAQMGKIMWFAELNAKGFRKILKKLDKKLGLNTQHVYWQTKVAVLPFACCEDLRTEMDRLTRWMESLSTSVSPVGVKISPFGSPRHTGSGPVNLLSISTRSIHGHSISQEDNGRFLEAIDADDPGKLELLVNPKLTAVNFKPHVDQSLYALLELASQRGSIHCVNWLLDAGVTPDGHLDINERNLLHKLCMFPSDNKYKENQARILKSLLNISSNLPSQVDFAGRRPLHYASEFDKPEMAKILLEHAIHHGYYGKTGFTDHSWQDREGRTPLFLAITHGNHHTLRVLIETGKIDNIDGVVAAASQRNTDGFEEPTGKESIPDFARHSHHPSAVAIACTLSNLELLKLLIEKNASVDLADEDGETALMIAIRNRFTEGARALIKDGHADVNLKEHINGWSPLIISAMEGCHSITEILLEKGADKTYVDKNGWIAYEHAVFRGYLDIGRLTKPDDITMEKPNGQTSPVAIGIDSAGPTVKQLSRASRLYGHKYLTEHTMIIVKLGSYDVRNTLSRKFVSLKEGLLEERNMSIAVSATGATGELPILDLPPNNQQHLLQPDPMVLFCSKPEDVVLRFDLVDTFGAPNSDNLIARGTAILVADYIFTKSGGFRGQALGNASLRGQQIVPLIRAKTLEYIGTIGIEYFVVTPFSHPKMTVGDRYTYYKSLDTKIIGHRGSGMNRRGANLQLGENTVLSFVTAASLGAEYVEFDVQLTKDMVPVIYHDWTVTETGFDIPLNAITLEQFLNLQPSGHIKEYHTGISAGPHGDLWPTVNTTNIEAVYPLASDYANRTSTKGKRLNRSNSLGSIEGAQMYGRAMASRRLELTRTNKLGKMKGNGPESIQAPFTTLAEALKKIPTSVGCNIEVKYPMVDEAEGDELHQFQEINSFVDTILSCVYDNAEQDRKIIFSSFHPEICLALNLKQPNYPVFFLTDAGTLPVADVRCQSLREAVRFAKQADLLGIVSASEPILEAPRMTRIIKESGLLLFTYGVLNNVVENAVAQRKYGVDAVIVDSVVAVRNGLRGDNAMLV
ncbi:Glycerophosphoryl diester phosphodiesterase family-domain-containing protein [Dichotomocladium elegans]|nr:Glycerophosphoryl diester phosphodiesterase family-domain-containing protein [Dichotomocladium elegans]